jgi:hypothetical protein
MIHCSTLSSDSSGFGGLPGFLSKHLWSLGSDCLHRSSMSRTGTTLTSDTTSLGGQCLMGGGRRGLMLQDIKSRTGPAGGRPILGAATCLFCRGIFFAARRRATPAFLALDRPIAMACLVERAPCFPCRMCSISSRTNSPA